MMPEDYVIATQVVAQLRPALAGHSPEVQALALAEALAIHLAGHIVEGNLARTRELRARLLKTHVQVVRKLIPVVARELGLPG